MKWIKLVPIIGIVLFIFILSRLDLAIIWQIYTKINITFLGLSLATLILTTFIKALKWNELIKLFSISYPIKKSMSSWLVGFFLSLITPAKIGDFARSFYLKKDTGLSFGKSLTTVIIDRLFEVGCLFIFGIIGVFYIIEEYGVTTNMPITLLIIFMFLVCGILVSFNKKIQESVIKSLFMFLIQEKNVWRF